MSGEASVVTKKDYGLSVLAGFLIGLLLLPVLKAAKPALYAQFALVSIPFFLIATPFGLVIAHYISKKVAIVWQLAKFVIIGVMNTLVDLGILTLLIFIFRALFQIESSLVVLAGISTYSFYKGASFILANINSYYWNKYWTFSQNSEKEAGTEFLQFFTVSLIGFLINVFIASYVFKAVSPFAGLNSDQWALIGAAAGSLLGLVWNFVGYKFIVFKKQANPS
ncbi:MAG: GtrA family protein [Patescibacteria group bacterium]